MKIVGLFLAASAALLAASPAFAQGETKGTFSGPRVGGLVGTTGGKFGGFDGSFTYGANVGYDIDTQGMVIGFTGEWADETDKDFGRDLSASIRVGGKVGQRGLIYGLVGYSNASVNTSSLIGHDVHLSGARIGGGGEIAISRNVYVNVEERYTSYERKFGVKVHTWQTVGSVGFRF